MKLFHLSDLHLGKRLNECSLLEDQEYILKQVIGIIDRENPDAILIAGDIYDKSAPSAEAVQLFDDFLFALSERGLHVFAISGNHDSPERIAFGARLMEQSGIHFSPVYNGNVAPVPLRDEYGTVRIYMLPFLRPTHIRRFFPDREIESCTDALYTAISEMKVKTEERNILITHQFVTGANRCESEDISIGGSDNVDAGVFAPFDYVALGHLHSPQAVGTAAIRYCGSPLKYSFSEAMQSKSITIVELKEKGTITVRTAPLTPKRDLREIRGTYALVTSKKFYDGSSREDYLHITLTDEEDILDAIGKLRSIYPNLIKLDYDNKRTRSDTSIISAEIAQKAPLELFAELYEKQNNQPMQTEQETFLAGLIKTIWEETE